MRRWIGAAAVVILILVVFTVVLAQSGQFDLPWHSVDSGGGVSRGGDFALRASIGQSDSGSMSGGAFSLDGGFLVPPVAPGAEEVNVFIPLLTG